VLCVDEKSQIQALDRTQPLLPMRPGQAERRTHDYKRHGTTSLFAALDVKAGTIIGKCMPRHRAQEFRRFLDTVETNVPAELDIHVIMDNASSHKTKLIRDWFAKRPRWHTHFTDLRALDQPGRAVLRAPRRAADQARCSPLHQGVGGGHRRLYRRPQCRPQTLPLDQDRRRYPRVHRTVLPPHPRRPSSMWIETSESGH
jgi:transposase